MLDSPDLYYRSMCGSLRLDFGAGFLAQKGAFDRPFSQLWPAQAFLGADRLRGCSRRSWRALQGIHTVRNLQPSGKSFDHQAYLAIASLAKQEGRA